MNRIELCAGDYRAEFAPDYGGNCIRLEHSSGASLLRTPADASAMAETPLLYGMPMLVPPNRIRGGKFCWHGREYRFPLNEPQYGAHCHGALYHASAADVLQSGNSIRFFFESTRKKPYLGFLHPCRLELSYRLDEDGLTQRAEVFNGDETEMPFAIAFHTTLSLAFEGGDAEEYALYAPVTKKFVRDANFLPTGEIADDFPERAAMNAGNFFPAKCRISEFMQVCGPLCRLTHLPTGNAVEYRADPAYRYRHFFNGGSREFICAEPQTCRIDGVNVWGEGEDSGVIEIPAGGKITLGSTLRFVSAKEDMCTE